MLRFVKEYRLYFLLLLLFLFAEIFVNPLADFPLNDDWSYSKSVKFLLEKNQIGRYIFVHLFV